MQTLMCASVLNSDWCISIACIGLEPSCWANHGSTSCSRLFSLIWASSGNVLPEGFKMLPISSKFASKEQSNIWLRWDSSMNSASIPLHYIFLRLKTELIMFHCFWYCYFHLAFYNSSFFAFAPGICHRAHCWPPLPPSHLHPIPFRKILHTVRHQLGVDLA